MGNQSNEIKSRLGGKSSPAISSFQSSAILSSAAVGPIIHQRIPVRRRESRNFCPRTGREIDLEDKWWLQLEEDHSVLMKKEKKPLNFPGR